jgi:hypothetical protein
MKRKNSVTPAVLAAVAGIAFVGCDGVTGPGDEFGTAELIYELSNDTVGYPSLKDASPDIDSFLIKGYDEESRERQLWMVNLPDGEPALIAADKNSWFGFPILSPDKENVVFSEGDGIYVLSVSGGEPKRIYSSGFGSQPFQWLDNETVLTNYANYVITVNINTLEVETLIYFEPEDIASITSVYLSPDSTLLACSLEFSGPECSTAGSFNVGGYVFRIYNTDTWAYNEISLATGIVRGWSPDGAKIQCSVEGLGYYDLESGEFVTVFKSSKLILDCYYAFWTQDSKHIITSAKDDNGDLRVYSVTVD